jgi:hypothetical protein
VIDTLTMTLMGVHALIALCMAWIGLTNSRANSSIVLAWFAISIFTVVALGQALR